MWEASLGSSYKIAYFLCLSKPNLVTRDDSVKLQDHMDEPVTLICSSFCDVKTCPDNENIVKAQAKEMGEISKRWPLNPFKAHRLGLGKLL